MPSLCTNCGSHDVMGDENEYHCRDCDATFTVRREEEEVIDFPEGENDGMEEFENRTCLGNEDCFGDD
jgi:hypothetical protein